MTEINKNPLVSICVPAYNHDNYVGLCIQSIIDQVPTAVAEVAPRVITPTVVKKEILEMDLPDFVLVCSAITLFFTNGQQKREEVAQNITDSLN